MKTDFYLDAYATAAYFEKDWFDQVVATGAARPGRFAFAPFPLTELYSPYHERFADLIASAHASGTAIAGPRRVIEIGASLGRGFVELRRRFPSIDHATLVEPSKRLFDLSARILGTTTDAKAVDYFPVLKGNGELVEVQMNTAPAREVLSGVDLSHRNHAFKELTNDPGVFDLVVCSNVVDQCDHPLDLVDLLKRATAPGGALAISCTYQWQTKYRGLPARPIRHLDELFTPTDGWYAAGEANIPFRVRINERYWMTFLSHACVFRKSTP